MNVRHFASWLCLTVAGVSFAGEGFKIDRDEHGLAITVDGKPFTNYVIDQANKPYLWPIHGPNGKSITRAYPMADVAGEQKDHPHHRGITFGHESTGGGTWKFPEKWDGDIPAAFHAGGSDTWHEKRTFEEQLSNPKSATRGKQRLPFVGAIKHQEFTLLDADKEKATATETLDYLDGSGTRFMSEERRLTFRATGDLRMIDFDQDLIASDGPVKFDDRKDAGLSIRVPSSMAVDMKKGGKIVNSDGLIDVAAWGKPAKWCAYYGPANDEIVGIAFLNHPSSFRHPTRWHVRGYGLFTANPFFQHDFDKTLPDGAVELKPGERLKLRHRFVFFTGPLDASKIDAVWSEYAK